MTTYSHSRLSCFESCPLKFKFHYIDKIKPEIEQTVECFLGSRVHEVLEKLYTDLKFQKIFALKGLLDYYNTLWKKHWNRQIVITRRDYTEDNYRKMGEKFLTDYYKKYHPFNQGRTIALEAKYNIALDKAENYKLLARLDRLVYAGKGVYEIHDYKTAANLPLQQYLDQDRQLSLYSLAVKHHYKDCKKVNLIWHFLAFDKELKSTITDAELKVLKRETIELIKSIEKEKEFKSKKSKLCNWCEFRSVCPEWAHLYKVEQLSPALFKEEDGVKLVNALAELTAKEKEIKLKIEQLKAEIKRYAKQLGVSVIFGSDAKATIREFESLKVPLKHTKEREALNKLIQKYNKWMEVSCLDTFSLKKILKYGRWPDDLLEKTKKLVKSEMAKQVRVMRFRRDY